MVDSTLELSSYWYNHTMQTIISLDQHELGIQNAADQDISWTRQAARAVLSNNKGQVAIMHFTTNGSYKLPGGGMEGDEVAEIALKREVQEEAGYTITNIAELGIVEEDRYFDGMHQISYCFTASAVDFVGTALTEKEATAGMELVWFNSIDEAVKAIESGHSTDEDGSSIGLEMMKLRDTAILRTAQKSF